LESDISDFLIITFVQRGPFTHDGPEAYEEVYDEDRKPIPGVKEEQIKAQLKEYFDELKNIEKEAKETANVAVEEAKATEPSNDDL
ncbi:hypothetical protein H0H93_004047, partial [Arthromyces matolae]